MRRNTAFLLITYLALTAVIAMREVFGLPFSLILAFALPLIGFSFALTHAVAWMGWRRAALFLGLALGVSLAFESLSVAYGLIYGPYHYTYRLGPLFLGLVPYVIPLTWFMMLYPSYVVAVRLAPRSWQGPAGWLGIAALGGVVMTSWDLVLDPLMVHREHWAWEAPGVYFGVPLRNYAGWWLTAFVILGLYLVISRRLLGWGNDRGWESADEVFERLVVAGYAATGLSHVLDAWALGLHGPAVVGFLAMAPWVVLGWRARTS